jgi:hypothetical protein
VDKEGLVAKPQSPAFLRSMQTERHSLMLGFLQKLKANEVVLILNVENMEPQTLNSIDSASAIAKALPPDLGILEVRRINSQTGLPLPNGTATDFFPFLTGMIVSLVGTVIDSAISVVIAVSTCNFLLIVWGLIQWGFRMQIFLRICPGDLGGSCGPLYLQI